MRWYSAGIDRKISGKKTVACPRCGARHPVGAVKTEWVRTKCGIVRIAKSCPNCKRFSGNV